MKHGILILASIILGHSFLAFWSSTTFVSPEQHDIKLKLVPVQFLGNIFASTGCPLRDLNKMIAILSLYVHYTEINL